MICAAVATRFLPKNVWHACYFLLISIGTFCLLAIYCSFEEHIVILPCYGWPAATVPPAAAVTSGASGATFSSIASADRSTAYTIRKGVRK